MACEPFHCSSLTCREEGRGAKGFNMMCLSRKLLSGVEQYWFRTLLALNFSSRSPPTGTQKNFFRPFCLKRKKSFAVFRNTSFCSTLRISIQHALDTIYYEWCLHVSDVWARTTLARMSRPFASHSKCHQPRWKCLNIDTKPKSLILGTRFTQLDGNL